VLGLIRRFAQGGDETVRELPADGLLQALQCRLPRSRVGSEGRDVREDPCRGRGSDLYEHGGTHGTGIGNGCLADDPWRE
jgi:hypothetical protein